MPLLVRATVLLAISLVAVSLLAVQARADESDDSNTGEEPDRPVGIGSRRLQPSFQSPRQMESHSFDRLASTAAALLEGVPGVNLIQSLPLGGTPSLRGLNGRRVAVLVDGLRLENSITPLGGDELLGLLDPLSLRRVELLFGPGAVVHGSGALGGAVDLQRQRLIIKPRLAWDAHGDLRSAFDSGRLGAFGRLAATGQLRNVGLLATAGLQRFGDLQSGHDSGRQEFTSAAAGSAQLEAAWAPRRGSLLVASYELLRQPDQARPDRSRWDDFQLQSRDRDVVRVSYRDDELSRWVSSVQATVRYRHERQDRNRYSLADNYIDRSHERVASLDAQVTMVSELSSHRLSYGLDFAHDWLASADRIEDLSTGQARGSAPLHPDGAKALHAEAFVLDQIALGSRLALEVGARGGGASRSIPALPQVGEEALQRSFASYAGTVHARYMLGDGLNLVAGLMQGYLTPNLDDLAGGGCHERGYRVATPQLRSEKSLTAEGGVKLDMYGALTGTLFYGFTRLFDAMVESPLENLFEDCGGQPVPREALVNAAANVHSIDGSLQLDFSRWRFVSWLSWARGIREVAGGGTVPLDRVAPLSGYTAARHQFNWAQSYLEVALRWVSPQDRLGPADRLDTRLCAIPGGVCAGSQSYFFFSLRGGMTLLHWLRLHMALENLTHERYHPYASGLPAPGFSGLVGLQASAL